MWVEVTPASDSPVRFAALSFRAIVIFEMNSQWNGQLRWVKANRLRVFMSVKYKVTRASYSNPAAQKKEYYPYRILGLYMQRKPTCPASPISTSCEQPKPTQQPCPCCSMTRNTRGAPPLTSGILADTAVNRSPLCAGL